MSRYPFQLGHLPLREAIAAWMERRFGVVLDPLSGLLPLIGSKEGIAHLPLATLNPGDVAVIPDPGYAAYLGGVTMAGAEAYRVPLRPESDFLVRPGDLPASVRERTRMVILNYPNNPTAASASLEYFGEMVEFCRRVGAILVHDHAYSEIAFDGYRPPSVLEVPGAEEVAIEFHSFSKTYNMTGWRLGWAAGSTELVRILTRAKTFLDTGVFRAVQAAGKAALDHYEDWVPGNVRVFQDRRDAAVRALRAGGFEVESPRATMYLWVPVPGGEPSMEFCARALDDTGVVLVPGAALGVGGEGFFRVALTVGEARIVEAANRLAELVRG
jgi:LL-diaminopimelate aminotransferase